MPLMKNHLDFFRDSVIGAALAKLVVRLPADPRGCRLAGIGGLKPFGPGPGQRTQKGKKMSELIGTIAPELLAYLAGVIDSDGCIRVKKSTYNMRVLGDAKAPIYGGAVHVKQVQPQAVTLLKECFGGCLYLEKPSLLRGKPLFSWTIHSKKAVVVCGVLLPYLRIKKEQAKNVLLLGGLIEQSKIAKVARGRGHAGAAHRPLHLTDAMETTFLRSKELNQMGVR